MSFANCVDGHSRKQQIVNVTTLKVYYSTFDVTLILCVCPYKMAQTILNKHLTLNAYYSTTLHMNPMKCGVQEEQSLGFRDNKFYCLPIQNCTSEC